MLFFLIDFSKCHRLDLELLKELWCFGRPLQNGLPRRLMILLPQPLFGVLSFTVSSDLKVQ